MVLMMEVVVLYFRWRSSDMYRLMLFLVRIC